MARTIVVLFAALICAQGRANSEISLIDYEEFFKDLRSCSTAIVNRPPLKPRDLNRDFFTIMSNVQFGLPKDAGNGAKSVDVKYKIHLKGKCPTNGILSEEFYNAQVDSVFEMKISDGVKELELLGDDGGTPRFFTPILGKNDEIKYSELTCVLDLDFLPEFNICPKLSKSARAKLLAKLKAYADSRKK